MRIIKIISRFIEYVKSFFKKESFLKDDDFLLIFKKSNELIRCMYENRAAERRIDDVRCIKEYAKEMLLTEEPEIFASDYQNAVSLAEEATKDGGVASECAGELLSALNALPRGFENVENELCYRVNFRNKRKTYCYISEDKKYKIGQHVLAPAGEDMKICVVRIMGTADFDKGDFPIPKEDLKSILGPALY